MKNLLSLLFLCLMFISCYRETGLPLSPVVATQITSDNIETMPAGVEATGIEGDYALFNNYVQIVVQGNTWNPNYCLYEPMSGGAIIDAATRTTGFSREQISKNDDGLYLLRQGVNLNSKTVIGYHAITVRQTDQNAANLLMEGKVFDLDHSLEQSGASVSSADRSVQNLHVQTEISLPASRETETNTNAPVYFFKITTVLTNTGTQPAPVHTVHDTVLVPKGAYDAFIPYPNWGFYKPSAESNVSTTGDAYPSYMLLQARQQSSANMFITSQLDGQLSANREYELTAERIMVGKFYSADDVLDPGEQITFIREFHVFLRDTAPSVLYQQLISFLQESLPDNSIYRDTGSLGFIYGSNRSPGGEFTAEHISSELQWFDGTTYRGASPETPFPIWGSRDISNSFLFRAPVGTYQLQAQSFQSEALTFSTRETEFTDEYGEESQVSSPFKVETDALFNMGALDIGADHASLSVSGKDTEGSRRLYRFTAVPTDGGPLPLLGPTPSTNGGNNIYSADFLETMTLPKGSFQVYISHGPLFNVNIVPVTISDSHTVDEYGVETEMVSASETSIKASIGRSIDLPGYFSADFGLTTAYHEYGLDNPIDVVAFAETEDLDAVFYIDSNRITPTETFLIGKSTLLGEFVDAEKDADKIKLEHQLVPSFSYSSRSVATEAYPNGKGRFAVLGLMKEEVISAPPQHLGNPAVFYDEVRQVFPNSLIMLQTPRANNATNEALFSAISALLGLGEDVPLPADNSYFTQPSGAGSDTTWLDFDLLQILEGNDYSAYLKTRNDWFNLLNAGIFKPIAGGSPNGSTANLSVGSVRTFVAVTASEHKDYDMTEFWDSARVGNMFVTNGPIIEASIGNATYGETVQGSSNTTLSLKVQSAPWVFVDSIRVYVDGNLVQTLQPESNDIVKFSGDVTLELTGGNHWVVIEAGTELESHIPGTNRGTFGVVYRNHTPIAITNPIFVEVSN